MVKEKSISLEEHIYHEIKKAIFSRKIGPKTLLGEEQLAQAFNVSRTPIRHVLKRLYYEKIVEIKPKKGAFIYEPSLEEIEEVFYVKMILEVEATKLAYDKVQESQLKELEKMTFLEEEYYRKGEYYNALITANNFHAEIIKLSRNQLLLKYYNELTDLTNLYLSFYDTVPEYPQAPSEHRRILDAIRSKDQQAIEKEVTYHWKRVKDFMFYNAEKDVNVDLSAIFNPVK